MKDKVEKTEELWKLYESALSEEYNLEKQLEKGDEFYFTTIEHSTKNGVANGILRSIEILENNKQKTWKRAFEVFCKVRGKEDTSRTILQGLAEVIMRHRRMEKRARSESKS